MSRPVVVMLVSAAVVALGCMLPWASVLAVSVYGFKTEDGRIVLGASLIMLAVLVIERGTTRKARRWRIVLGAIAAAVFILTAAFDWNQFVTVGLWLVLLGGIGLAGGVAWSIASGDWSRP